MRHGSSRTRRIVLGVSLLAAVSSSPVAAIAAELSLSWTDNSPNESGFLIRRKTAGPGPMTRITRVGQNSTAFTDTGLIPGTVYCYRVRTVNAASRSKASNRACTMAR